MLAWSDQRMPLSGVCFWAMFNIGPIDLKQTCGYRMTCRLHMASRKGLGALGYVLRGKVQYVPLSITTSRAETAFPRCKIQECHSLRIPPCGHQCRVRNTVLMHLARERAKTYRSADHFDRKHPSLNKWLLSHLPSLETSVLLFSFILFKALRGRSLHNTMLIL